MARNRSINNNREGVSRIKSILLSPKESFLNGYESYFRNQSRDYKFLVSLITLLVGFGVIMVLSSSNVDSIKSSGNPFSAFAMQLLFALAGLVLMLLFSTLSPAQIEKWGTRIFFGGLILQLLVKVPGLGVSSGGNSNWISLFGLRIQPSEFLKLGLIIFMASFLSKKINYLDDWRSAGFPAMVAGFFTAGLVFVFGNDLGTAGVILVIVMSLVFIAGLPKQFMMRFVALIGAGLLVATAISPNRMARIFAFLIPSSAQNDLNWQVQHGTWALASGGVTGTGLGQAKLNWGWIPEVENDFIFAVIGEEWGLIGAIVVLVLFFVLFNKMKAVAIRNIDPFASLVTWGITLWIILQALINIAVVLGLMPVLGVPLPLISKGGSSLVALMIGLGMVLAFERNRQPESVSRRSRR